MALVYFCSLLINFDLAIPKNEQENDHVNSGQ